MQDLKFACTKKFLDYLTRHKLGPKNFNLWSEWLKRADASTLRRFLDTDNFADILIVGKCENECETSQSKRVKPN